LCIFFILISIIELNRLYNLVFDKIKIKDIINRKSVNNKVKDQYILFECIKKNQCGGLADRIKGKVNFFNIYF